MLGISYPHAWVANTGLSMELQEWIMCQKFMLVSMLGISYAH